MVCPNRRCKSNATWLKHKRPSADRAGNEFRSTIVDLTILAGLARYHSARLLAGVSYNLYKQWGDIQRL